MNRTISRAIVAAGGLTGLGLVMQPATTDPEVLRLVVAGAKIMLLSSFAGTCTCIIAYAWHNMCHWNRILPPAPNAVIGDAAGGLSFASDQEAVHLQRLEMEPADDEHQKWERSIVAFAFIGARYGFGWRAMRQYVPSNDDWKRGLDVMTGSDPPVLEPARGNIQAQWTTGWYYSLFRLGVQFGAPRVDLPYSTGEIPLRVNWQRIPVRSRTNANERTERWNARIK